MNRPAIALVAACLALALAGCEPRTHKRYRVGDRAGTEPPSSLDAKGRVVAWEELRPATWDAAKAAGMPELERISDFDPRAAELMEKMQRAWRDAPVNVALDATDVRISGFVVPLDFRRGGMTEFLLVPYFGACIHVPPPPPNQIVHVSTSRPVEFKSMSVVWVAGRLQASATEGPQGRAAYRIADAKVVAAPAR